MSNFITPDLTCDTCGDDLDPRDEGHTYQDFRGVPVCYPCMNAMDADEFTPAEQADRAYVPDYMDDGL
jgi:hypothetical protein